MYTPTRMWILPLYEAVSFIKSTTDLTIDQIRDLSELAVHSCWESAEANGVQWRHSDSPRSIYLSAQNMLDDALMAYDHDLDYCHAAHRVLHVIPETIFTQPYPPACGESYRVQWRDYDLMLEIN